VESNLWTASPTGARSVHQITFGSGEEGAVRTFDPAQDSTILFETIKDGSAQIFAVGADGSGERSLTTDRRLAVNPCYRPDVGMLYMQTEEDLTPHIWRADANGENGRQLTFGKGERILDVSPDGRSILFQRDDVTDVLWSVSSEGGEPVRLGVSTTQGTLFSPDGARILHVFVHEVNGLGAFTPQIMPAKGGGPVVTPAFPPRINDVRWTPDGSGFTYLHAANELKNIYRLSLSGGAPVEITHFAEGRIQAHRWSPDGKQIVMSRRIGNSDNLWVVGADGKNPTAVTDFETGNIDEIKWSRDGSRIYFTYGASSQNVVLIRNFR
jgi:Tol biopolymer transport system component